jgi:hypothetical protein
MKKKLCIFGIIILLINSFFISTSLANQVEEDFEELELNWKILVVIGGIIKICWDENELYGFGVITYTDGETSLMSSYNIKFQGIPLVIKNGILLSYGFYKSVDV